MEHYLDSATKATRAVETAVIGVGLATLLAFLAEYNRELVSVSSICTTLVVLIKLFRFAKTRWIIMRGHGGPRSYKWAKELLIRRNGELTKKQEEEDAR